MHKAAVLTGWLLLGSLVATALAENQANAVYTMNVDGSDVRKLAHVEGHLEHTSPRWSHDGKLIVFDAVPENGGGRILFVVGADGAGLRQIGPGSMASWSPDDKQFAGYLLPLGGRARMFVENIDGQGRVEMDAGKSPQWSPDGSRLLSTDGTNLIVSDLTNGQSRPLFDQPFAEVFRGFEYSPDGKRLAVVVRPTAASPRQLLVMKADGTQPAKRLQNEMGGFVSFSPDGKQLIFSNSYQIYIIDVEGAGPPKMVPGQRGKNWHPAWSPDGRKIVFLSDRDVRN